MTGKQVKQKIMDVSRQIAEKYRPEKIILFGSAAWGKLSSDSDIDFLVIKNNVPIRGIDRLYEIDGLIERNGIAIDMLVLKQDEVDECVRLGDPFMKEIVERGKVLYG